MARYTYGDSDLAGDRLALVARLFRPDQRGVPARGVAARARRRARSRLRAGAHDHARARDGGGAANRRGRPVRGVRPAGARSRPRPRVRRGGRRLGLAADRASRSRLRPAAAGPSARSAGCRGALVNHIDYRRTGAGRRPRGDRDRRRRVPALSRRCRARGDPRAGRGVVRRPRAARGARSRRPRARPRRGRRVHAGGGGDRAGVRDEPRGADRARRGVAACGPRDRARRRSRAVFATPSPSAGGSGSSRGSGPTRLPRCTRT